MTVLIKKVAFECRHILADVWEEEPHVVLRQPNPEIPVFAMRQIDGRGLVKSLHRNEPHSSERAIRLMAQILNQELQIS